MTSLPLKIRADVRDQFTAPTSATQKAFNSLKTIIGYDVACNPEWAQLWNELGSSYPDKGTFVPSVTGLITAWCDVLSRRLEDDKFAAWTEELLENLESLGTVKLILNVSEESRPNTTFSSSTNSFAINIPKKPLAIPSKALSGFQSDFHDIFNQESAESRIFDSKDNEWAAVDETCEAQSISMGVKEMGTDSLPSVDSLPRPDVLFRTLTPYLVHVTLASSTKITVNATHEPTLHLLSEYLKRWTKADNRDSRKIPIVNIILHESHFGLGLTHDTMTIEAHDQARNRVELNLTAILVFLEGVLGYRVVHRPTGGWGGPWELKRDIGFST